MVNSTQHILSKLNSAQDSKNMNASANLVKNDENSVTPNSKADMQNLLRECFTKKDPYNYTPQG